MEYNSSLFEIHFQGLSLFNLPPYAIVYVIIMSCLGSVGIVGNAATILVVLFDKQFQESRNLFLVSLSLADFLVSTSSMPASIGGLLTGKTFTERNKVVCTFTALICAPSCIASLYSIVWIAVSRYYYITKYDMYMKYFTKQRTIIYVTSIWFLALMVHLPNHYGWGDVHYSTILRYCTLDTELFSYLAFFASFLLLAIILSFIYYAKIYMILRQTTLARGIILGNLHQVATGPGSSKTANIQNETKMIKATFKIFVLFFICWAPLTALFFIRFFHYSPPWVYLYAEMLAHGNSTLNFLVYFTSNETFVKAVKKFSRQVRSTIFGRKLAIVTPDHKP